MGRNNKVVKRVVLLFLSTTCVISVFIFINLYFISTTELQFSAEDHVKDGKQNDDVIPEFYEKDPEIVELEKKIDYILQLYKDGKEPNLVKSMLDGGINLGLKAKLRHHGFDSRETIIKSEQYGSKFNPDIFKPLNVPAKKKVTYSEKKKSLSVPGILNVHIWEGWCGPRVEDLKRGKHFPLYPSFKTNISLFFAQWNEAGYGERIFGYIHPPETGNYIFAVSCDDNCEIWLSNSSSPLQVEKIAYIGTLNTPANTKLANFRQYQSQISKHIYLVAGKKYYIEALHKQAAYKDHVLLTWLAPSWQRIRTISSKYISSFISDDFEKMDIEDYAMYIPESPATFSEQLYDNIGNIYYFNRTKYKFGTYNKKSKYVFVESSDFMYILPSINYKPSYVIDFVPKRYEGVKLIHESSVFPNDNTALTHMYSYEDCLSHRQDHPHLSGLFPGNSLKTSIDEGTWFDQLTFDKKFKYLINLYSKKIKYIVRQHNLDGNGKKTNDHIRKRKNRYGFQKINIKTDSLSHRKLAMPIDMHLGKGLSHVPKDEKNKQHRFIKEYVSSNFKGRKLLNFEETGQGIDETDFQVKKKQSKSVKYISDDKYKIKGNYGKANLRNMDGLKASNVLYRSNSYLDVDDDALPPNLMENSIRDNPISIPAFVRPNNLYRKNDFNLHTVQSFLHRKTPRPFVTRVNNWIPLDTPRDRPFIQPRRRAKIHPMITNKIYFKDGVFINGTNTTKPDPYHMGLLYTIFGASIYHLSQVPERYFLWKYNQHLSDCKTDGNLRLSEEIALSVVYDFMEAVKSKHGSKYSLKRVVNVEENHDVIHGDRYLIEIDLDVKYEDEPHRFSSYIYKPVGSNKLFQIKDFRWNPHATVHIIIPVKDQGRWVKHFILNMEKIYTEINDPYLNIILVDFNSTDIDIEKCLKRSKLKRYQVISLSGPFQRALGVQAGADAVENPDDVIFTCDLHLEIPSHLIESIRKHTIKERMAFAPMVFRLSCGYTPELPFGLWEIQGYGLFAISKYDFDRIGGMNTKEFKTKWGGEDWEFLDRVLEFGLEVERMRIPQFYHYYHSKKRMWVAPKSTLPPI